MESDKGKENEDSAAQSAALLGNDALMASAAQVTADTAAFFGVDLTTPVAAEMAAEAQEKGVHVLWAETALKELRVWCSNGARPLFGEKYAVLYASIKKTCDMIEMWNKLPSRNRTCRAAFVYFAKHVTAAWSDSDTRAVHDRVRDADPAVWGDAICRAYAALTRGLTKEQFSEWFATLNAANQANLRQTYLKVANGIYQMEPAANGMFSGITDQLAQIAGQLRAIGGTFEIEEILPLIEQMFGAMLGSISNKK